MALRYLSIKPNKLKCPAVEAGITGIQAWKKRTHKAAMPMIALRYLETSRKPFELSCPVPGLLIAALLYMLTIIR